MTTAPDEQRWLELRILLRQPADRPRLAARVRDALLGAGVDYVNEQDPSTLDGRDLEPDQRRLVVYLDADEHGDEVGQRLLGLLDEVGERLGVELDTRLRPYHDTSWRDGWKAFFRPARVSPRLAIRAPWAELEVPDTVETLVIEPGMAFGTGLHETTRLCLEVLDRVLATDPVDAMLDVGCGSGVLSIAAARLGVAHTLGLDLDAATVAVSEENAAANGVAGACRFAATPAAELDETWPLVVANILGHILLSLRDALVARTAPGGRLVLSGLLLTEEDKLVEAYTANTDLTVHRRHSLGEWACLELVRPDAEA